MFPQKNRVTKKIFDNVIKNGKVVHGEYVYVRHINAEDDTLRCSTVVPKKVFKKAHDRNRVKRQVNALLQQNKISLPIKHFIFFAKPSIRDIDKDSLSNDIAQIISQLIK